MPEFILALAATLSYYPHWKGARSRCGSCRGTGRKYHPTGAPEHVCRRGAGLQSSHGAETQVGKTVEPGETGGAAEMGGLLLVRGILEKTYKIRDS